MLKLERVSKESDIAIRFRVNEPILTRHLLIGFAVAIFLHLLFFVVVQIKAVKVKYVLTRPPIFVESDMGAPISKSATLTNPILVEIHGLLPRYIPEPEAAIPSLPEMPPMSVPRRLDNVRGGVPVGDGFRQVELVPYTSKWRQFARTSTTPPIRIRVVGSLASRTVEADAFKDFPKELLKQIPKGQYAVKVEVRIDDRTGKIFWKGVKDSSEDFKLDDLALHMTEKIQFNSRPNTFVSEGEIEFLFTSGE